MALFNLLIANFGGMGVYAMEKWPRGCLQQEIWDKLLCTTNSKNFMMTFLQDCSVYFTKSGIMISGVAKM